MSLQHRTDTYDSSDPGAAYVTSPPFDALSLTLRPEQQPPGGEQDEECEWIGDPLNAFDERDPGADRQRPEHERACDAEQQHATLIFGGNVQLGDEAQRVTAIFNRDDVATNQGRSAVAQSSEGTCWAWLKHKPH